MTSRYNKVHTEIIRLIKNIMDQPRIGCEIGVWGGGTARCLLREFKQLHLLAVDSYKVIDKEKEVARIKSIHDNNCKRLGCSQDEKLHSWRLKLEKIKPDEWHTQDGLFNVMNRMLKNTMFAADRRILIVTDSVDASKIVQDESLDFVFIDAAHDYKSVVLDIKCWFPKVRKGGLVSGHDYGGRRNKLGYFGVNKAVDEFAEANNYTILHSPGWLWSFIK